MSDAPRPVVTGIHIHPVKSCRRIELDRAVVDEYGIDGDREWQIQGPARQMMTQRKFPDMARIQPVPVPGGLRLQCDGMPDLEVQRPTVASGQGKTMTGLVPLGDAGDEAAAWLERVLSIECRLTAIAWGYERRVLIGGDDVFGQQASLVDAAPIHLVSAASHRFLLQDAVETFPIERFRPNLVVDGCEPWVEDTWRELSIGDARIRVALPWPRCAMPQVDQDTGQRHREPAVVLKRHRWCTEAPDLPEGLHALFTATTLFGVAGSVEPAGAVITVGTPVEVLETGPALLAPPRS
jgi:uncharacterized protein YcbX